MEKLPIVNTILQVFILIALLVSFWYHLAAGRFNAGVVDKLIARCTDLEVRLIALERRARPPLS
jgi:hypothetical protein